MCARLADEQAGVGLHAYGVGRGVDREELLRIISACDPDTAEDRWVLGAGARAWRRRAGAQAASVPAPRARRAAPTSALHLLCCACCAAPRRYLGLMVLDEAPW